MSVAEVEATWNAASGSSWAQGPQLRSQPCWWAVPAPRAPAGPAGSPATWTPPVSACLLPPIILGHCSPGYRSCGVGASGGSQHIPALTGEDTGRRPLCCPSMAALFATCTLEIKEAEREVKWALTRARTVPGVPEGTCSSVISPRWFWQMLLLLLPGSGRYPGLGWNRVNFLHSGWHEPYFGFRMRIALITLWRFVEQCLKLRTSQFLMLPGEELGVHNPFIWVWLMDISCFFHLPFLNPFSHLYFCLNAIWKKKRFALF